MMVCFITDISIYVFFNPFGIKCSDGVGVVDESSIERRTESGVSGSLDYGCVYVRCWSSYYE